MLLIHFCLFCCCCMAMALSEEHQVKVQNSSLATMLQTPPSSTSTSEKTDGHQIKKRQWRRPGGGGSRHHARTSPPRFQKTKRYQQSGAVLNRPLPSIDNYYFPILLYRGPNRPLEPIPVRAPSVKIQYPKSKPGPRNSSSQNHVQKSSKPNRRSQSEIRPRKPIQPAMDRSSRPKQQYQDGHRSNIEPPPTQQGFQRTRMHSLKDEDHGPSDDDDEDGFDEYDAVPVRHRDDRPRFVYTRGKYTPPRDLFSDHSLNMDRFQGLGHQTSKRVHQQLGSYGDQYEFENYEVQSKTDSPYGLSGRTRQFQRTSSSRQQQQYLDPAYDFDYPKADDLQKKTRRPASSREVPRNSSSRNTSNVPRYRYSSNAPEYIRPTSNSRPKSRPPSSSKQHATTTDIENTYANFELHKTPSRTTKAPMATRGRSQTQSGRKMDSDTPFANRSHRPNNPNSSGPTRSMKPVYNDYYYDY